MDHLSVYVAHSSDKNKRIQTVEAHLQGVAAKAEKLARKLGLSQAGLLIGLLHDFGKYSQAFQKYIKDAKGLINSDLDVGAMKGKIDHSTAGAQWIHQQLSRRGNKAQGQLCAQMLAICIASHHSGLIDCLDLDGINVLAKRMEKSEENAHLQECISNADASIIAQAQQILDGGLRKEMTTLINRVLNGTQSTIFENRLIVQEFYLGFLTRCLFSCLIDADRTDSADFEFPEQAQLRSQTMPNWVQAQQCLENKLASFNSDSPIAHIRRSISDSCMQRGVDETGLFTLSVPTGGGKTLASLRFAIEHAKTHQMERIFYIIPYTSIIEQNAREVREILGDDWVLEQHSNLEPEVQTWQSKILSENWDAPIVFTTMVQFLETLFGAGTRGVRRLHQLANSVIIFDEIQTLPIQCTHLFCNALNFLTQYAKTTAVLCTATQPLLNQLSVSVQNRGQLNISQDNEIIGDVEQVRTLFAQLERVQVENRCQVGGYSCEALTDMACAAYDELGSCLVIVNTKDWAQKLYQACQARGIDATSLFHLSTNQCAAHRKMILDEVRERLKDNLPVLCVSTQLIEAGVDVSFAQVLRFLAGVDSIAQAAGRCNRHGELRDANGQARQGQVWIVNPDKENIDMLIDIKEGQKHTERVLNELGSAQKLLTPEGVALYFTYYFHERSSEMVYPITKPQTTSLLNLLSDNHGNIYAHKNDRRPLNAGIYPQLMQSFMSAANAFKAIDAPTQAVIVPYGEGKNIIAELCALALENKPRYRELLKQAQKYSVNVFPNVWKKLQQAKAVAEIQNNGIYFLDEQYYSEAFGLSTEKNNNMDFCGF